MKSRGIKSIFLLVLNKDFNENDKVEDKKEDYIEKSIGAFGLWQAVICVTAAFSRSLSLLNMLSMLFLTPTTVFKCIKFKNNATTDAENSTCYDNCLDYEYKSAVFENSLISDFELICDRAWLASFTQTILMFGLLLGTFSFGWFADRFGRRKGFLLSGFINTMLMVAVPFSPDYWTFTCLRFFIGMASGGTLVISSVYVIEIVGNKYREIAGSCAVMPDGFIIATLAIYAYYSTTWKTYLLGYSIVCILILFHIIFLPESPRWLMSMRKETVLLPVMTNAAKWNKMSTLDIKNYIEEGLKELKNIQQEIINVTYADMFRTREVAIKTTSIFLVWVIVGISYFGISQHMTFIIPDVYMIVVIQGLIQIPGSFVAMYMNKVYGRKAPVIATFLMTSGTISGLIFVPEGHWIVTILGVIGICSNSVTFNVVIVYVAELFPTQLRSMSCAVGTAGSIIGGMISPFLVTIRPQWISSLIFAVIPLFGSLICILLPETKGLTLQDTII